MPQATARQQQRHNSTAKEKVSLIRPARRISADRRRAQGISHVAQHKMRASAESSQVLETQRSAAK